MKSTRLIRPFFSENRLTILLGIVCLVVVDFLQLLIPRVIKWAVDDLAALQIAPERLFVYAGQIVGLALAIAVFRYVWRRCLIGTSRVIEEGLRNRLFAHVQTLSAAYFAKTRTGDLMAHATNDIQHVRMATGMGMVALTDGIVLGAAAVGFMLYMNPTLTLFVLIPMPMIIFGARFFSRRMHRLYKAVQASFADMTETVRERFSGIRILQAYTGEETSAAQFEAISRDYIEKNLKLVRVTGFFFPMMLFFSNLSMVIVLFLGGRMALDLTITPGDFVAFISYIGLLTWPMMAMGWVTNLIQRGKASLDRIDPILRIAPEIRDTPDAVSLTGRTVDGSVRFEGVGFSYAPDGAPALEDIRFEAAPGTVVGLVGPPGSGKSTLLGLISRIYDVTAGQIVFGGLDIRTVRVADLRARMAAVPQEPFLFSGTIRENILAGTDDGDAELAEATERAALDEAIRRFPDGFDTVVGERGVILSGGQKQRVAMARALLRRTPLLLLDDPISQVDTRTAAKIIAGIRSEVPKRTVIIASHRLSALFFADQILVLDQGRITDRGRHEELMGYDNFYARTFRLQEMEEEALRDEALS